MRYNNGWPEGMNQEEISKEWRRHEVAAKQEMDKIVEKTHPLEIKEFPITGDMVGTSMLSYSCNTVHEYTMRYCTLACFGGFIVEYKYKDRHHLNDKVWVNKWISMYKEWYNKGWVMPMLFEKGVMKMDMDLYDKERNQTIELLGDNKISVTNESSKQIVFSQLMPTADMATKEYFVIPQQLMVSIATEEKNLNHQYTTEEIGELTARSIYMLWMYPSHATNEKVKWHNENTQGKRMSSWDMLNELTGNKWFVLEGRMPEVTFQLEIPQPTVNPTYLAANGFVELASVSEEILTDMGVYDLETYLQGHMYENSRVFAQKELHRYQFAVIYTAPNDHLQHDAVEVFVKNDIGCGWINIPMGNWCYMTVEAFEHLYYAIRREPLVIPVKLQPGDIVGK